MAIPRVQPPEELAPEEAEEWRAVTNRMPSDYFGREHYAALVQKCRHVVAARRIAQLIEQQLARHATLITLHATGQQFIVPKNREQRTSELSLIVVTDVVVPHWLSSPIRT
jgi:hypothetical protein